MSLLINNSQNLQQYSNYSDSNSYKVRHITGSTDSFHVRIHSETLGEGRFKTVKKGRLYPWGTDAVCTKLKPSLLSEIETVYARESYILGKLTAAYPQGTRGLARCYGTTCWKANKPKENCNDQRVGMIFDYYNAGTLKDSPLLGRKETVSIAKDILLGLSSLHRIGILHNDLKADNILLNRNETTTRIEAYITDFGISCDLSDPQYRHAITINRFVASPELKKMYIETRDWSALTDKSDMYSLGLLFDEWISETIDDEDLYDIVDLAMSDNPNDRPSINQLIEVLENIELQNDLDETSFPLFDDPAQIPNNEWMACDSAQGYFSVLV